MVEIRKETSAWREKFLLWMVAVSEKIFRILFTILHQYPTGVYWSALVVTVKKVFCLRTGSRGSRAKWIHSLWVLGCQCELTTRCPTFVSARLPKDAPQCISHPTSAQKILQSLKTISCGKAIVQKRRLPGLLKKTTGIEGTDNMWWERHEGKRWWQPHSGTIPCRVCSAQGLSLCFSQHSASPALHYKKKLKPLLFKYPPHDELHYPSYFQGFPS